MTGMAAVALGGLFSSCSKEMESVEGSNSVAQDIVANYEAAFITRFGQPAENQTWGFGPITTGTRAVVEPPSVTEEGYTFNAQMAKAWEGVEGTPSYMAYYTSWRNSGWNDKFYTVNGTVVNSTISSKLKEEIYKVIVGENGQGGLIPEGINNLETAQNKGYSIVTKKGPVTLTPIYHNSSSGDKISYYYYPQGSTPDVKTLKKYTIGNMADPQTCQSNHTALNSNTYSLVYEDASGKVSYEFPENYVIDFIISNTDLGNGDIEIADAGTLTYNLIGRYALEAGETIQSGTQRDVINGKVRIKFGNTTLYPQFDQIVVGTSFRMWDNGNEFKRYYPGNGVNGNLDGGTTCYYFKANQSGYLEVGVRENGGTIKVYNVGNDWENTNYNEVTNKNINTQSGYSICGFPVEGGKVYAVYAENGILGYYGYTLYSYNNNAKGNVIECNPLPDMDWGPDPCGTKYENGYGYNNIYMRLGKAPNPIPDPLYFAQTNSTGFLTDKGYPAYTAGIDNHNGGFNADATTYFIRPTEAAVLKIAVKLSKGKTLSVIDLGQWGWTNTSGTTIISDGESAREDSYYGIYEFNAEANHVYAVYAEGSRLGFFGCELGAYSYSGSQNATKTIANSPEFYGDGNYNVQIHNCTKPLWGEQLHWYVSPATTPHAAVFDAKCTDESGQTVDVSLIGFEDWTDLDFNDVIFAVTGTKQNDPPVIIVVPDPEPEPLFRIVAEDLTVDERGDFDFNDVVFDVCPDATTGKTTLIIRAVGGELPLYIGLEGDPLDDAHDVHKVCGIGEMSMTNTGWDGPIKYDRKCGEIVLNTLINDRGAARNNIYVRVIKKKETIRLSATPGRVPSMICVGTDYKWCPERKDIDDIYHTSENVKLFSEYVAGRLGDNWYQLVDQSGN
jgi:hypothetical protein